MDTIFAPIAGGNGSPIIIIRVSGNRVLGCLRCLGVEKEILDHQVRLCKLYDNKKEEMLDLALVTFFKGPFSFTGEDVIEIALHGSSYILKRVTDLLLGIEGVRLAEAGEFSKRAFLNGKMDLVQAEAVVDLVEAETKMQHSQALRQMQGELGKVYTFWREELIKVSANIEAFIDFPDEDLPSDIIDDLEDRVTSLRAEISEHLNDNEKGEKIRCGLSLAIIGAPNVGKSSLINYLAKSEVAIVSDIAGTTRDIVNVHLNIAGVPVIISDTAGIRDSNNAVEKEGVKRALKKAKEADLKILVIDAGDIQIDKKLIDNNTIIVVNKIDLNDNVALKIDNIAVSIKQKINLEELLNSLEERVKSLVNCGGLLPITRARYRHSLGIVVDNLSRFYLRKNIEFAAEDLRLAIREIGKITGKVEVDDILSVIFAGFCIGK